MFCQVVRLRRSERTTAFWNQPSIARRTAIGACCRRATFEDANGRLRQHQTFTRAVRNDRLWSGAVATAHVTKHMIVGRRQVRRPGLPQPMSGTCDKPCRFVRSCGNQNLDVFRHLPKRQDVKPQRQSGYTLSEQVVWNTNLVQSGSVTEKLNTSFRRSRPCLNTLGMRLAYPRDRWVSFCLLECSHGIRCRWHERWHALHV